MKSTRTFRTLAAAAVSMLLSLGLSTAARAGFPEAPVDLGSAADYVVIAATTITNASGPTVIVGNVALFPGTSMTGFPPGVVTGRTEINNPIAQLAQSDLTAAYIDAMGRDVAPITVSGNIGGTTLYPGLYKSTSSLEVSSGILTIDAQGDPNAVFIIQTASTFGMTSGQQMVLTGGAKPANIYWVIGSSATFGTTSVAYGNVLALVSITCEDGASVSGRMLARTGAVTVDNNPEFGTSPPYVTNVTSTLPNGLYGAGTLVPIQIEFNEPVDVTGLPSLDLNSGPFAQAIYSSGSGTSTLNFDYNVVAPDSTPDLDYDSASSLAANGTINSSANLAAADLALADPGTTSSLGLNKDIEIDTTAPMVLSIQRVDPSPTNLAIVAYDVTFTEEVNGVAEGNFSFTTTAGSFSVDPSFDSITGLDGTTTRRVFVNTGTNNAPDATFRMDLSSLLPLITDLAGNPLTETFDTGETYTVDVLGPIVVSILRLDPDPTNAATVQYEVTFDDAVTGVAEGNFSFLTTNGSFSVQPSFDSISGANGDTTRIVTVNTGTNDPPDATFRMDLSNIAPPITDDMGNELTETFNSGDTYTVDSAGPTVLSITRLDPNPTSAASVDYHVTFSEPVDGVAVANFSLAITNGSFSIAPGISSISGSDGTDTRIVTVDTGVNTPPDATFRMDLSSTTPSIIDSFGNALTQTFNTGETYTVDRVGAGVGPTVLSILRVDADPTNAATVRYDVTFSEAVDGVASGNFSFAVTDGFFSTPPSFNSITGANGTATRRVTVNTGTNLPVNATFRMDLSSTSPAITDAQGDPLTDTFSGGQTYTVDKTGPTVLSITRVEASPTNATVVHYDVTFSEPVNGVASGNFTMPTTQGSFSIAPTFNSITGSNGTSTRRVAVNTGMNTQLAASFRLSLSSATPPITDALGNALTLTNATGLSYIVDKARPVVLSINRLSSSPSNAATVQFDIAFSEAINGLTLANLSLPIVGGTFLVAPTLSAISGADGTSMRRVTVNTGTNNSPGAYFSLSLSSSTPAISDMLGNTLSTFATSQPFGVDKTRPTVSSIGLLDPSPTTLQSVRFRLSFSESLVTAPTIANFALVSNGTLAGYSITSVTSATGFDPYTITVDTGTGDGQLRLDMVNGTGVADPATNPMAGLPYTSGPSYTVNRITSVEDWSVFD